MAAKKETSTPKKTIIDVAHPGQSAPATTAKPVIVTNRPILKDPMVVSKPEDDQPAAAAPPAAKTSTKPKLQPLTTEEEQKLTAPAPEAETAAPTETTAEAPASATEEKDKSSEKPAPVTKTELREGDVIKDPAKDEDAADQAAAEHAAAIQKLVDSKKYFLPINSVEKRRTKRIIILGLLLSVLLLLAWVDIALDAGLISIDGVNALTDFF